MFALGDTEWPGLSKLAEEAGETLQVIGKLIQTRGLEAHWDGTNLRERLEDELADLKAAMIFVVQHCNLDGPRMEERSKAKLARFERWHETAELNHLALR
jgi:NTP pyrophosphatase (non-canonical NTP hydrolase)